MLRIVVPAKPESIDIKYASRHLARLVTLDNQRMFRLIQQPIQLNAWTEVAK
jgi:hypothetical protein